MRSLRMCRLAFGAVIGLASSVVFGAPIYDSTINTGSVAYAVTPGTVSNFVNCFTSNGCMGKANFVWDNPVNQNASATSTIPSAITYSFALTAAEKAALLAAPAGAVGQFFLTAGRDIGIRQGANPEPDFLPTTLEGSSIGTLFQSITSTCPAGERGTAYAADLVCGPNFHTDIAATDALTIPLAALVAAAGDGLINIRLAPSSTTGRLIIFSAELRIDQKTVAEPGTLALIFAAFAALGLARRRLRH